MNERKRSRSHWLAALLAMFAVVLTGALATGAIASKSQSGACASIGKFGLAKQMNAHASQVLAACGNASKSSQSGSAHFSSLSKLNPAVYGGTDVNEITGGEGTYPNVTQSETQTWAEGNTVVTSFNDSRTAPNCYAGASASTDNGATFTPLNTRPFCTGHGTNYGDPVILYDRSHAKWIAIDIATGCGGQGLGAWTSTNGTAWTAGACVHNGGSDDRESGFVDNNASSPHYGRVYISWNDFASAQQIRVTWSDDGGTTWHTPVDVNSTFIRNVQLTVGLDGTVFIAAMDEGGGGLAGPRTNIIYRSTNGGTTWTSSNTGASFTGPGTSTCDNPYFAAMFPSYWRHMGWGDIGAGPGGIIHYAYAKHGTASDAGDIYYVKSTDNGLTWSTPLKLNTDSTARSQWQPSLSVSPDGHVMVSWYDARNTTGTSFERYGRQSADNGATWENDAAISDVVSPLPLQPDPGVQPCYTGDYDRSFSNAAAHYVSWVDGRVLISGQSQQDVYFDKHTVGPPPPPAPNLVHDLTTLIDGNGNGYIDPGESFGIDERIRNAGNAGATGISGVLTTTTPGITISQGSSAYPDIAAGANGTNVTRFEGSAANDLGCGVDVQFHLALTTDQGPFAANFTLTSLPCGYVISTQTGMPIIPGTTDIGNHCDDCTTAVTLPFPITLYGQSVTDLNVASNGTMQAGTDNTDYSNVCLPAGNFGLGLFPYWNDLRTDNGGGIYSDVTGTPPNRQFVLEWRAQQAKARAANRRLLTIQRAGQGCAVSTTLFERVALPSLEEGQRTGALRFGDPRTMALVGALCITINAVAGFTNRSLRAQVAGLLATNYTSSQMTYDLRRLRRKGLIQRVPRSNTYSLTYNGLQVAIFYTKVYGRLLRPLLAVDHPPAVPELRQALRVIDSHVVDSIKRARLPTAA